MKLSNTVSQKIKARAKGAKVCVVGAKNKARNVGLMLAGVVVVAALSFSGPANAANTGSDNAAQTLSSSEYKDPFDFSTTTVVTVSANGAVSGLQPILERHEALLAKQRSAAHLSYTLRMETFDRELAPLEPFLSDTLKDKYRRTVSNILLSEIEKSTETYRLTHGYALGSDNKPYLGTDTGPSYINKKELALQKILDKVAVVTTGALDGIAVTQASSSSVTKIKNEVAQHVARLTDSYRTQHGYEIDSRGQPQTINNREAVVVAGSVQLVTDYTETEISKLFANESSLSEKQLLNGLENSSVKHEFNQMLAGKPASPGQLGAFTHQSVNEIDERLKAQQDARESSANRPG